MLAVSRIRTTPPRAALPAKSNSFGGRDFAATLLAMAGHDLRQPLQIITSAHDVLAATLAGGEQREELARAEEATSLLAMMLGQIVEALQLHEVARGCQIERVFVGPVLQDLAQEFYWPARTKNISLKIAPSRAMVFSHPVLLRGMLRNLLRNAVDYTPAGGHVAVTCRRCARGLRIAVRDTGIGIRRNARSRVFVAFERVDSTRTDGLGLGLFIVKRTADLLDHQVELRSVPGRGSCFTVIAPPADFPTRKSCRKPQEHAGKPAKGSSNRRAIAIVTELYPTTDPAHGNPSRR